MIRFNPKNPEIEKIFNRFIKYPGTTLVNTKLATSIGRCSQIKRLREKNHIYFGYDRQKKRSIIFFPPNVKIKKNNNGNGFIIDITQFY